MGSPADDVQINRSALTLTLRSDLDPLLSSIFVYLATTPANMQIRNYIVFGASGRTGREVCRIAKEKKHHVVAVIRNPDQAREFEKAGIHTVLFDISSARPQAYVKLLEEQKAEVVVWAAGTADDTLAKVIDYGAQVHVYDAMEEAGVRRVMVVGSIGIWKEGTEWPEWYDEAAKRSVGRIRELVPHIVEAKYQAEHHLRQLKHLDYTIIRPGGLSNDPATGVALGKVGVGLTSREAVAQVLVASVSHPGMYGRTVDVLNGEVSVAEGIKKVIKEDIDTWVGEG